ncbi:MAG: heavy metal translocating P-type ATPase [Thermoguttaceae bacterium]
MFWRKRQPLLHCEIVHALPGRLRIRCRALRYLATYVAEIRQRLQDLSPICQAQVNVLTQNVLLHYDHTQVSAQDVLELTELVIGSYSLTAYKAERAEQNRPTVNERRLQEGSLSEMVTRIGVTTATLVYYVLRKPMGHGPATLAGRFLTVPSLTAASLAIPIFRSGLSSLATTFRPNADTLSATAILASIASGRGLSALTILWLADIAELLTAYTMGRTRRAIRNMLSVGEETVWRLRDDDQEERVDLDQLHTDDRIMVHTGEKISVDGVVESGEAAVDQASITGEYMPLRKVGGEQVFAGTVVKSGRLVIRAVKVGDQTAVARIVHMVEEATHRKANVQTIADRFSAQFIPVNFLLALIVYLVTGKSSRALNMLIIDYSCGVRLSTATALSASICTAARNGILIKGSNYLELLAEADTLIFDKTGTMTVGRPEVISVIPMKAEVPLRDVLQYAGAAEETSTHPMAAAIVEKVRRNGWQIPSHHDTQVHVARGVETHVDGRIIRVGSRRFMQENAIELAPAVEAVNRLVRAGENIVYVAEGGELLGVLGIQDALRENMKKAINRLRYTGIDDIVLLTGDVEQHAEIIADRMTVDRYKAEAMPDDKAETVLKLQSKGTHVVMVGDGINDAPALAYADVGIAMGGTRTDIAMEAADITITGDDPLMIPAVIHLASRTMQTIRQNFAAAVGVNTLGLVLASIGVLPVFWGAVLHNSCTVGVVLNSSRLLFHDVERRTR